MKVVFCTPTRSRPHPAYIEAMAASVASLDAAGIEHYVVTEVGCAYISYARSAMLRKALDIKPDCVVFIDDDLSWEPDALTRLVQTKPPVVSGLYRFKLDAEQYMGELKTGPQGRCIGNDDGLLCATKVPGGFLKLTLDAVALIYRQHPELVYGPPFYPSIDLFNHGAHSDHLWWGEDYAFSRRWIEDGGELFVLPDLTLTHHGETKAYPGNFHEFMLRQPGGVNDPSRACDAELPEVPALA